MSKFSLRLLIGLIVFQIIAFHTALGYEPTKIQVVDLPVTFDPGTTAATPVGFGDPSGAGPIPTDVIANPDMSGINMTDSVWSITKVANSQIWAGASIDIATAPDLTMGATFSIQVWSPRAGIPIRFKMEDAGDAAIFSELDQNTTVANAWETLTFDLSMAPTFNTAHSYTRIAIFPDFGTMGMDETFYFDAIEKVVTTTMPSLPTLPVTFDEMGVDYTVTGFGDPSGAGPIPTDVIANPDMSGINMTDSVWSITKVANSQIWAGASIDLSAAPDLTMGATFTVQVWSPRAGIPIRFKMEDAGDAAIFSELDQNTTVASAWETLTFDLTQAPTFNTAHSYTRIAIFPDFGTMGMDETFFIDAIEKVVTTTMPSLPTLPVTFDEMGVDYTVTGFGDPSGAGPIPTDVIANPDMSGINMTDSVWSITKVANSQIWAGASIDIATAPDLTMGATFSIQVWSPRAGIPIRFKMEDAGDAAIFSELDQNTTVASAWETLTFDLTQAPTFNTAHSYTRIAIFPDFGTMGMDETFFIDAIEKVVTTTMPSLPTLPVTFDEMGVDYTVTGFGDPSGAGPIPTDVIANPDMSGINMTDSVWSITKVANSQIWAGASIDIATAPDLTMGATFSIQVWSPRAGIPIRFKMEDAGDAAIFSELDQNTTVASAWETLTFDLTQAPTFNTAHSYTRIAIFPDFGTMGMDETFFIDAIEAVEDTTPPAILPELPVTFEDTTVAYNPSAFGNATASIIPNPDASGDNTSATVLKINKPEGPETFAGVSIDLATALDLSKTVYTVKVWSPRGGVPVRFKAEDLGDPGIFSEIDDTTSVAGSWETLTFDLSKAPTFDAAHVYKRIALFPDFGSEGPVGGEDYFMDDIMEEADAVQPDPVKLPITFESATADYAPAGFGDATPEVLDNPDMSGENTSGKVMKITKAAGAQVWGGASIKLDEIVDLTPGSVFSVQVWSPAANTPILLKFEDTTSPPDGNGNPSIISEVQMNTTVANAWETLSFDLSTFAGYSASHNYNQVVLFPNFGTSPTAEEVYYFDNILNVNAVSIDPDLFSESLFKVYPNPARNQVRIDYSLPLAGSVEFVLVDLLGRTLKEISASRLSLGEHSQLINLTGVQSGAYMLMMKYEGELVKHTKLLINN